jgi:hypothetical protein
MELHLKINDVVGMDDQKRHILHVDGDQLLKALMEHKGWIAQNLIRDYLLKHDTKLLNQIIDDNDLRNTIYMNEKARREGKAERRERHRLFEIERQRRQDQHKASIATRKALNFYRDILGITEDD